MTIVKDQHGNRLSLSTRRLTELEKGITGCYLDLKDLIPGFSTGLLPLYFRGNNGEHTLYDSQFSRERRTIGCCAFSRADFAKILTAAKAAQKVGR